MKYSIKVLSDKYADQLSIMDLNVDISKVPTFDLSAYYDNEYLNCISSLNDDFDRISDLDVTESFIKGD